MSEKIPINLQIFKWARTSLGLSVEEVAHKMNKSANIITEWEDGTSTITYSQLEKLAYDIYKRPIAVFFFPKIPEEDTPQADFRTLPNMLIKELPPEIIKLYRKAKVFQLNLEELYNGELPVQKKIIDFYSLDNLKNIQTVATNIREDLDINLETQIRWKDLEKAYNKWRDSLELNGIFIFNDAFRNDYYSGFCIYHNKYPIIYVNNSMPTSRQIFTLFHELAHLLFKTGGVDFRSSISYNSTSHHFSNIEKLCNCFANEILIPRNSFINNELLINERCFNELANKYSVSREVILRNYFDLNLINESQYHSYANRWIEEAKNYKVNKTSGGNYYYNQKKYLGDKYVSLAFKKYYHNKISIESLAGYLGMKVKNITTFEHYAFG